ncbi:U4/U6.U5 small nuclear ribonucleoprotein 27 kDa protein [Trichinella nativa]|uniref:U4/U6.U5 small nuclear ribonucleoprotein 27 kDa protein n=1 Tax=Trichinella nativa TaxID=6335 RepID=A0A0V1L901_9BILA|nr:U4/U6.U5 small nuclear ribonucleoprotein 27 kDa protein [Trichinella nativa]
MVDDLVLIIEEDREVQENDLDLDLATTGKDDTEQGIEICRSSERHEKRDRRDHREKERKKNDSTNLEVGSDDQAAMKEILGFSSFDTTKGKKVENNCTGDAHIHKKRKYRQYMNRRGGFNRPLDPVT